MTQAATTIVFALFPGVTQLDFTGPHEVFSRLPGAEVIVASRAGGAIETDGLTFAGLRRLADGPPCGVVCVPGGFGPTPTPTPHPTILPTPPPLPPPPPLPTSL